MNLSVVSEATGHYEISQGISKKELEKLCNNPNTQTVQFSNPLSIETIHLLETVLFSKRPDITLRIYGFYNKLCDLTIIEQIPSLRKISADCLMNARGIESVITLKNLEELGVGIYNLENFDFLEKINSNITSLSLHQTKSKKPKIDVIERFSNLEELYLEGQQNGIEAIKYLYKLKDITLRSISTKNVEYLSGHLNLWSVDIKLGGINNFDALTSLPKIKYLELWQVRDLKDLSFISELTTLQYLFIQSLKQVTSLPDFNKLIALRRIELENLKGLSNLSTLGKAPALEEFVYVLAENQQPENLIPMLENPSVNSVFCKFGSAKKNERFDELALSYKKKQYRYSKFNFQ